MDVYGLNPVSNPTVQIHLPTLFICYSVITGCHSEHASPDKFVQWGESLLERLEDADIEYKKGLTWRRRLND